MISRVPDSESQPQESLEDKAFQSASRERGLSRLLIAYVSTGLFFMVFPGTLIGVWNLFFISGARSADAAHSGWVQAHGHAQVFGWIGSFILGIGFYSIPKLRRLAWFPLSTGWFCWVLWTLGVLLRWAAGLWSWNWRILLPLSAGMELTAFLLFFQSISRHHARDGQRDKFEAWVVIVMAGTFGLLLTLTLNLLETIRLALAGETPAFPHVFDQRFLVVATWGFLVPFVWGFSSRWMPVFLGLAAQREPVLLAAVALNTAGVIAALAGWFLVSSICLLGGAAASILALRMWETPARPPKIHGVHPSFPSFVRIAYGWLVAAALLGVWGAKAGGPGIWGASRHALTVGFLSTMVFSVGSRVLPAFSGMRPLFSRKLMFAALAMLTCGCALRVSAEVLAYQQYASWAWGALPFSALAELSAVLTFAVNLAMSFAQDPIVPLRGA
jgi:hypothetical protein